jgi:mRNA interferase RelE/StbE
MILQTTQRGNRFVNDPVYQVVFIPEAVEDYKNLDGSVKKSVNKKIDELERNPFLGELLGHKFNIDLSGFYKLYVHGKKFRIVYRLIDPENIEIVEIWGIGKREKEEIYRKIGKRIKERDE